MYFATEIYWLLTHLPILTTVLYLYVSFSIVCKNNDFYCLWTELFTTSFDEHSIPNFEFSTKTSPKGFSASKFDVGNWIFSKLGIFEKFFGNSFDFFGILFGGFFGKIFFGGIFWEDFFERIFWEEFFVYIVKVN